MKPLAVIAVVILSVTLALSPAPQRVVTTESDGYDSSGRRTVQTSIDGSWDEVKCFDRSDNLVVHKYHDLAGYVHEVMFDPETHSETFHTVR